MKKEEALQVIKAKMDYYESDRRLRGAIETLFPELKESEDEKMRNALWNLLHLHYAQDNAQTLVGIEAGKFRSWLKSLKPQPKQEWSEDIIRRGIKEVGLTQYQIDWLKNNVFPPKENPKKGSK